MGVKYAGGKFALGICDICGFSYKLRLLKKVVVRQRQTETMACPTCWDEDHPQNMQGMYPVFDPEALENPRPDTGDDS